MKTLVLYDVGLPHTIVLGHGAIVHPLNHPDTANVSNSKAVITSKVVRVEPWGQFETENTVYNPVVPGDDQ